MSRAAPDDFRHPRHGPEFPTADLLRSYGDAMFLAMRSDHHRKMSVALMREAIETPLVLGQFQIFRFDDVPRGMLTWALLGDEAERRYVSGGGLRPEDWQSGNRLWLIDLIAPYPGLAKGLTRWVMERGNFTTKQFWFRRLAEGKRTRRVVHIDFDRPSKADVMDETAFLARRG